MPAFLYRALRSDGSITEGEIEAGGRPEAFRHMESQGLRPISLRERDNGRPSSAFALSRTSAPAGTPQRKNKPALQGPAPSGNPPASAPSSASPATPPARRGRITGRILENFTRLLSSLLSAGVPLSRAMVILQKEAANDAARAKWREVHGLIVDGVPLAEAMSRSPDTFPRVYVDMVEAGEAGGFIDVVLAQIADFQSREREMRGKVMTALLYPVILLALALAVLVFLLVFFIPRFQGIFAGFGAQLPLLTRVIVGVSDALRGYGVVILGALALAAYFIRTWLVSPAGRRVWESSILRLPTIGPLVAQYAMARFCRMLGTLLGAGVPLISGLQVARRSIGNQILVDAVTQSIERVKEGKALGTSLGDCRQLFPGSVLEMVAVAEESGRLDQELVRIANVTESDLDRQLRTAVALAEPLLLFLIAAFIGTIFVGMVIPIFTLQDYIK
ncbi:MAG: type II secretion system F family protein [Limisphaerales bacterium]